MPNPFKSLLEVLVKADVQFILIGGVAANLHGSARATFDLDLLYDRSPQNFAALVAALSPLNPYLRGAPPGLPFRLDEKTLANGLNFTLTTSVGDLDLFGEVPGGGTYENLLPNSIRIELGGLKIRCATLDQLIFLKNAAGRPKDFESVAELKAIQEERESARQAEEGDSRER
jgi:predicted nucleotidyltransferase